MSLRFPLFYKCWIVRSKILAKVLWNKIMQTLKPYSDWTGGRGNLPAVTLAVNNFYFLLILKQMPPNLVTFSKNDLVTI